MRLKNFDSVFQPDAGGAQPNPRPADEEHDLSSDQCVKSEVDQIGTVPSCPTPPCMSVEDFKSKHPSLDTTITINMGTNITCFLVAGKVFVSSEAKIMVPGVCSENAKPIFLYAGGSWLSESAKVPRFDTNGKVVHVCVCQ